MSIYFGNDTVNDLYIGLTPVTKGYVGTHLFYNGDNTIIDLTYEKYILNTQFSTLYNTAKKPVKSAILSGMTLANLLKTEKNSDYILGGNYWVVEDDYFKLDAPSVDSNWQWCTIQHKNGSMLQPNSKYLMVFDVKENSCNGAYNLAFDGYGSNLQNAGQIVSFKDGEIGIKKVIVTTSTTIDVTKGLFRSPINIPKGGKLTFRIMTIPYQKGMENWDIPYFEGMQSVKMPVLKTTGKNLFNKNNVIVDGYIISNGNLVYEKGDNRNASDFIEVEPNCTYRITGIKNSGINGARTHQYVGMYDKNEEFISVTHIYCVSDSATFTTTENTKYIRISVRNDDINRLQIEKGTAPTTYEPHKSNILTCNEDVTLRSNGNICDELNLLTGQLTQRIDEDGEVLSQEVVKTVDLSVVDQDGKNTKLSTFDDLTHVTLSSEGLIPEAELEVATKNEEVLNTMSLEMDDISTTQTTLEETSNTQSENVDATMMATTEIYEQLL